MGICSSLTDNLIVSHCDRSKKSNRNITSCISVTEKSMEAQKHNKCNCGAISNDSLSAGGCDDTLKAHAENRLMSMINESGENYDYDLIVIGGGSGGLAASKVSTDL